MRIDEIVGCNVRGRLEYILDNLNRRNFGIAKAEIKDLLEFFPEEAPSEAHAKEL